MTTTALFPGTFDPITRGHIDLIKRAATLFDKLIVAVADNTSGKQPCFALPQRVELVKESVALSNVVVQGFSGLLTDLARTHGATVVVRGVRSAIEAGYEMQIGQNYQLLMPEVEVLLLPASPLYSMIASHIVREIAMLKGDLASFVTEPVAKALQQRFI
jgi:pantetheine-phosphate adenylyltransferase